MRANPKLLRFPSIVIALAVSVLFSALGVANLRAAWRTNDIVRVARLIERGSALPDELVDSLDVGEDLPMAMATCRDDATRAGETIRLFRLSVAIDAARRQIEAAAKTTSDGKASGSAALPDSVGFIGRLNLRPGALAVRPPELDPIQLQIRAQRAVATLKQRLECAPTDGNAWLRYAIALDLATGERLAVLAALRNSYWTAPSEKWVITVRLNAVGTLIESGTVELLSEFSGDLWRLTAQASIDEVAEFYIASGPYVRMLLSPFILREAERRRRRIVERIDTLGVSFK